MEREREERERKNFRVPALRVDCPWYSGTVMGGRCHIHPPTHTLPTPKHDDDNLPLSLLRLIADARGGKRTQLDGKNVAKEGRLFSTV